MRADARALVRRSGVYAGAFVVLALLPVILAACPGARHWRRPEV